MGSVATCRKRGAKAFIVDVPATLLKRNTEATKAARALYSSMRAICEGKTGALRIRGRWLKAKAIDAAAEMCRDVRMRAMRELVALGLVTTERERVERVIGGRRRVVLGVVHYFVHRQPVTEKSKKAPFLLKSIPSTVEEIDSQVFSNPPVGAVSSGSAVLPVVSKNEKGIISHHHPEQPPADDDSLALLRAKAEQALSKKYDPEIVGIALDHILERIVEHGEPIGSHRYILKAFENLWASREYNEVFDEVQNRKRLREKFMSGFTGELTPEMEERRRAFIAMRVAEVRVADSESAVLRSSDSRNTCVFKRSHDGERVRTDLCQQEVSKSEEPRP
jgi:hypothetical protein